MELITRYWSTDFDFGIQIDNHSANVCRQRQLSTDPGWLFGDKSRSTLRDSPLFSSVIGASILVAPGRCFSFCYCAIRAEKLSNGSLRSFGRYPLGALPLPSERSSSASAASISGASISPSLLDYVRLLSEEGLRHRSDLMCFEILKPAALIP